ncbi:hypothetical protein BCR33DRAFT_76324 [Rhizoclosmatium globosum]|uniref:Zn(2)-C6 fungal-type domain-containing protein n=1 Tax=Rhizoclosmatium globosum TaxID=329046 RepID=A0A1Y2CMT3_9FUNG|nr:hypothetical protein BCR33DRAFT_76324 [Rhizoclosmatium globosum]|eukprot:ORY47675.1 hypothetical protein BCR33DRAFT_76324 [Rhizoclosmatium globosum]
MSSIVPQRLPKIRNCDECRRHNKACSKDPDGCVSCKRKGIKCVYINQPPQKAAEVSGTIEDANDLELGLGDVLSPVSVPSTSSATLSPFSFTNDLMHMNSAVWNNQVQSNYYPINPVLQRYVTAFETPLEDFEDPAMQLEDPDLMPTVDDWLLVYNHYTNSSDGSIKLNSMIDIESLLREYFHRPAVWRLILCCRALQAKFNRSEGPGNKLELNYYRRARKAFFRADASSSVDVIMSYFFMHVHARDIGEQDLGEQ